MMSLSPPQPLDAQSCWGWVTPPPIASPGFPHPRPASSWGEYGGEKAQGAVKTVQILEARDTGDGDSKITAERFPLNNELWKPSLLPPQPQQQLLASPQTLRLRSATRLGQPRGRGRTRSGAVLLLLAPPPPRRSHLAPPCFPSAPPITSTQSLLPGALVSSPPPPLGSPPPHQSSFIPLFSCLQSIVSQTLSPFPHPPRLPVPGPTPPSSPVAL
ncbi:hypothetical protein MC885_005797 [Smutsia gigantea]|nr:hypothetical protein MC885_005797 [Smutsia gigantea]